jgi:chemotaxis protein histidine kinase CheA
MPRIGTRAAMYCVALGALVACTKPRASAPLAPSPVAVPAPVETAQPSRQLVRRGRIGVQVTSLAAASDRLERSANGFGAQVTRATVEERERAEYFIRVPPERLDALMDSVAALGEVESRSVGVEDVTERVIDAEARLNSLRASRDRLRQLLERAGTVQDVIAVERELARVQGEIESLEARLTALRGEVALSELSVTLRQRPVLGPLGLLAAGLGTGVRKLFLWR